MARNMLRTLAVLFVIWSANSSVFGQPLWGNVSLGLKQNNLSIFQPDYVFFPSIEIEGKIVQVDTLGLTLDGAVHWSYWFDAINEVFDCPHCYTYKHRAHVIGVRLVLYNSRTAFPLQLTMGMSHHFLNNIYVGGFGNNGEIGENYRNGYWSVDPGGRLRFPLGNRLFIFGEVIYQIALSGDENGLEPEIYYRMALSYQLRE